MNELNLNKKGKYLLACSFGPDSMALLFLLYSQGYKFDVAIVNYHLREESNFEVKSLREFAKEKDIRVHVFDVEHKITGNIEKECRDIRYSFFKDLYTQYKYDAVLVAHHQDDLIETYILQKNRQNLPIYYGIKDKTVINGVQIVRPLLGYTKKELETICVENHVPYSIDKTNFDISYKRNEIRHKVIDKLSDEERTKLLKEIDDQNYDLAIMISDLNNNDLTSVEYILNLNEKEQKYALNLLVKKVLPNTSLSKQSVGQIILILKSSKPNVFCEVKKGLYLLKEYDKFKLTLDYPESCSYSYTLDKPGKLDTDYFYLDFSDGAENRNISISDYPLTIRKILVDDSIVIHDHIVSARRLMIDWKMPVTLRMRWPVITNHKGQVIYIPRYQKDFKVMKDCNFYVKY